VPEFFEDESRFVVSLDPDWVEQTFPGWLRGERKVTREELLMVLPLAAFPSWFVAKQLMKEGSEGA
jgi:hypothetical protein